MKKQLQLAASALLILGFGYLYFYMDHYSVDAEESTVHKSLLEWNSRGVDTAMDFTILDITQIAQTDSYIVLFELNNKDIGYGHLRKGWNGKYKIIQSGWGDNVVSYTDIKTNDGIYGVLAGKNPDLEIDHIVTETVNQMYEFSSSVSNAETFVRYEKMPRTLKQTSVYDMKYYDKNRQLMNPMRQYP